MAWQVSARAARRVVSAAGVALVAVHFWIFRGFFPNAHGGLGVDYGYFLPQLLDGEYWRHGNGLLSIPWFTPAFCGGLPRFPNPQSLDYSLPQLLAFLTDPLTAVRLTLLVFAGLGYWGFYLLQRRLFAFPRPTAVLGAALFLFNSLFSARMLIGHLTFHCFMLVPFVPLLLLSRAGSRWDAAARCVGAACALAYIASHAIAHVFLQTLLIALLTALLQGAFAPQRSDWRRAGLRSAVALPLGAVLCASKLSAMAFYLHHFPRTLYPLPGVSSLPDLLLLTFRAVFQQPQSALIERAVANGPPFGIGQHEFEFGVTAVPLYVLGAALVLHGPRLLRADAWRGLRGARGVQLAGAVLILCLPLALNYYQPGWNAFLKSLPVLANSSSLFRWFSIYVPAAVLMGGIALEYTQPLRRLRVWVAALSVLICLGLTVGTDRVFYRQQHYDPRRVLRAFQEVRQGTRAPRIDAIGVSRNAQGRVGATPGRNDLLADGKSQLYCYEPLLGSSLERFPRGELHQGPVLGEHHGALNLKDPSCYVFPEANRCAPGQPFPVSRREEAAAFASYRPFPFAEPAVQRLANAANLLGLGGVSAFLLAWLTRCRWRGASSRRPAREAVSNSRC